MQAAFCRSGGMLAKGSLRCSWDAVSRCMKLTNSRNGNEVAKLACSKLVDGEALAALSAAGLGGLSISASVDACNLEVSLLELRL